jgi:hypothetical protein
MNRPTLAFLLAASSLLAVLPATAGKKPACARVEVSSDSQLHGRADRFEVASTIDLVFSVVFSGVVEGDHVVELRLTTPRGHHYQTLTVPFGTRATTRKVKGKPFPMKVVPARQTVTQGETESVVDVRFAVAGTPIVHNSLYGRWQVEAFVDGEEATCGAPLVFTLSP